MKKIILSLSISLNIILAAAIILNVASPTVEAKTNVVKVSKSWYQNDGDLIVDLNDGSWIAYNPSKDLYTFQPVNMGDWDYNFDNKEDLEKAVSTYIEVTNNLKN